MYITKIIIDNVRCFEHIEINLMPSGDKSRWTVILGDNAMGKTTILRSISMGLCDETGAASLFQDTSGEWIRWGKRVAYIEVHLNNGAITKTTFERTNGAETVSQETPGNTANNRRNMFVCGYGANRSIYGSTSHDKYSTADALYTLFNYDYPAQHPELMLRRWVRNEKEIDEVLSWLAHILMLDRHLVSLDNKGLVIARRKVEKVYPGALADGHTSMITLVLDMLGWALLAGQKKEKNLLSGIVLIDEIEQHLHPSWQKYIIKLIHDIFPNIQFITTTHSPLCAIGTANLSDSDKCSLVLLSPKNNYVEAYDKIQPPRGKRADQVLTSWLFGLETTRSDGTFQMIEKYSMLLSKEKRSKKEEEELKQLRRVLNKELGSAETQLQQLVEDAVHKTIAELVSKISVSDQPPHEAINLEIRRQLKELLGKGGLEDR